MKIRIVALLVLFLASSSGLVAQDSKFLHAKMNVMIFEKTSEKNGDKVTGITEKTSEYSTNIVLEIYMGNILSQIDDRNISDSSYYRQLLVMQGDSYFRVWDYTKGTEPVISELNSIKLKETVKREGLRGCSKSTSQETWGLLYNAEYSNEVKSQHVVVSVKPYFMEEEIPALSMKPNFYTLEIRVPIIPELYGRNYSDNHDGSAQGWNYVSCNMEDAHLPSGGFVPYAEDCFYQPSNDDKVSLPVIPTKLLDTYLLNPQGSLNLNLHGTAFRSDDYKDLEITMDIRLVLSPGITEMVEKEVAVAMEGCSELGVGEQGQVTASGKPEGVKLSLLGRAARNAHS